MDCAAKFERDVAAIPGVTRAELNFTAAKLTVEGSADLAQVTATGKAHNVTIRPDKAAPEPSGSIWQTNPHLLPTVAAFTAIMAAYVLERLADGPAVVGLYAAAILIGGLSTFRKGIRNIGKLEFDMNALMAIAVVGAAAIGEWGEGAVVAGLFRVSEMLETYTMDRARQSIRALMAIAPKVARIRRPSGGDAEIPVEEVQVGDTLIVRPGEKLAMDGQITMGRSAINQAAITGESIPADKGPGDEVFAGTLNGEGALEVRVTKLVDDTTLAKVIHLVEEAQAQRAPTQTFVDRFARIYTPAVMALAAVIMVAPPLLLGAAWQDWIYRGLSLLVVACPCALVISTPVSIVAAISNAARNGVLIKGGAHLERAASLQVIAFDKTGTLTRGQPEVTDVYPLSGRHTPSELLCLASAVEEWSEHPLARAVLRRTDCGHTAHGAVDFTAIAGRGARATLTGQELYVGSPTLFRQELGLDLADAESLVERWQNEGKTVMLVGTATELYGAVAVADTPRADSAAAVAGLKRAGIATTVMLTGDNTATGRAIGAAIGVDEVRAELMPQAKVTAVRELAARHGAVGMVGDGVNDAPALAAASVGIAMGGAGTDVALETADIALMGDDLSKLPFTIALSRATLRVKIGRAHV